jgi:hypothetical protein
MNNNDERDYSEERENAALLREDAAADAGINDELIWVTYDRFASLAVAKYMKETVKFLHSNWVVRMVDLHDDSVARYVIQYHI